jgi:hypothetical protein
MILKTLITLLALVNGAQKSIPQPIVEPPVFDGIQSNVIPGQCPVPHFQEQCLQNEITRTNAQQALTRLAYGLTYHEFYCAGQMSDSSCLISHFKSYTDQELKLLHNHINAHTCRPNDHEAIRRQEAADVLFRYGATAEELRQDRYRYWNSNNPGQSCSKKKLQQRARLKKNQERNQKSAAE